METINQRLEEKSIGEQNDLLEKVSLREIVEAEDEAVGACENKRGGSGVLQEAIGGGAQGGGGKGWASGSMRRTVEDLDTWKGMRVADKEGGGAEAMMMAHVRESGEVERGGAWGEG